MDDSTIMQVSVEGFTAEFVDDDGRQKLERVHVRCANEDESVQVSIAFPVRDVLMLCCVIRELLEEHGVDLDEAGETPILH
jgi:hypothetical protein